MMRFRAHSLVLLLAGLVSLSTCADTTSPHGRAVSPADAISASLDPGRAVDTTVKVLRRTTPLAGDITRSAIIGREGGTIAIPDAGFALTIPAEALRSPTRITVTAVQGSTVAYEFAPHGLSMRQNLVFAQDLSHTVGVLGLLYKGGYFKSRDKIDQTSGTAVVHEIIDATSDALTVRFPVTHFSGYLVAVGSSEEEKEQP